MICCHVNKYDTYQGQGYQVSIYVLYWYVYRHVVSFSIYQGGRRDEPQLVQKLESKCETKKGSIYQAPRTW